ncbi:glutamate racemase [Paenibacillus xylaniclasticus]|uniref:glutamate racemase n=1 Tax=Paenibacillus xylaniclasticus TaxID=588083 RepID=UPI000FD73F25|nr:MULTISPECIES: glutamate racemase [Paenibacillus]GFN30202.1 glutamate racemase [Paenibacillus curdlanolyticus]
MQQPIAILDSGVGGLTVAKEVMRQLPKERIVYFGDTARTPYGPRPAGEIIRFTEEIVDYLVQYEPKMIVIACNTATAVALEPIKKQVRVPVVGVIYPGARAALGRTRTGVVGVIGTEGTIKSRAYEMALMQLSPNVHVISQACPTFVPLVEQGNFRSEETYEAVRSSLLHLREYPLELDCLILGCTHYPFLAEAISEVMGPKVALINSAEETAREIRSVLKMHGKLAVTERMPVHRFFCSGQPAVFKAIAQQWLGEQIELTPVVWQISHIG